MIYRTLKGVSVVPNVKYLIQLTDCYALVMENAGTSLKDFFAECEPLPPTMRQMRVSYYASKMVYTFYLRFWPLCIDLLDFSIIRDPFEGRHSRQHPTQQIYGSGGRPRNTSLG